MLFIPTDPDLTIFTAIFFTDFKNSLIFEGLSTHSIIISLFFVLWIFKNSFFEKLSIIFLSILLSSILTNTTGAQLDQSAAEIRITVSGANNAVYVLDAPPDGNIAGGASFAVTQTINLINPGANSFAVEVYLDASPGTIVDSDFASITVIPNSVSNNLVKKCSKSLNLDIKITENINEAEVILGLKSHLKDNLLLVLSAKRLGIPIYSIQKNTIPQITQILSDIA